ncbi:hypothetical protein RBB75_17720 [Tunturibacter empetritectus]|uniref:Uncharacterized protein n=1 Tax=Tunturiibacter empetritectus TaxID=3069691 RepID=A0AAU7ZBD4_9BACT
MHKTLFVLALLASALSIPPTAHADTMYQITFDFPSPPGVRGGITTLDFAPTPYFIFSPPCPPLDCLTVLATDPAESGFYSLIDFTQISPTEMVVGYAPYSLSFPYPPSRCFHQYRYLWIASSLGRPS